MSAPAGGDDEAPQPWAPTGRYGSDWSSDWGEGAALAPGWSSGGPVAGAVEYDAASDGAAAATDNLTVGVPVKYVHHCCPPTGRCTEEDRVLVDRAPFNPLDGTAPRIVNIGKCPVQIISLPARKPGQKLFPIHEIDLQPGAAQEPWKPVQGTVEVSVYCTSDCEAGELRVTIERPMV